MKSNCPTGLIVAVTTPFDQNLRLEEAAFSDHLQWLTDNGVRSILIAGTTGEFFSLTHAEKERLLLVARARFRGRILFHAGTPCLADTLRLSAFAADQGADALLTLPPFYLANPDPEGLICWLNAVADATLLPFLIYHFPRHTQVLLTPEILHRIRHCGIKDSSGTLDFITHTPVYLIGSDTKVIESYHQGGSGFVSARANASPGMYVALETALKTGDIRSARSHHQKVLEWCTALSGTHQISRIKTAIAEHLPRYPRWVRPPLVPMQR